MRVFTETVSVTTTGSAGVATGSATSTGMHGQLLDVYVNFHASAPATTDTTIAYASPVGGNILAVTSSATDVLLAPRQKVVDNANSAITNSFVPFTLNGTVTVSLAECDALVGALVVTFRYLG